MIPGVDVYHPRADWVDPAYPISGPNADTSAIHTAVIHYTAASAIPQDVAGYLRAIQRDWLVNRGYSIGYRHAVSQTGAVYQCRGWEFKSAANKGNPTITGVPNFNVYSEPILMLVNGADMASPMAVRSAKAIIAESQRRSGRTFRIVGHGELDATACPGAGLRAQIKAGVFTPSPDPTPPPTTPPTLEDDDMPLFIAKTPTGGFHVIDGVWRFSPARADVVVNMHAGVGKPLLDFATGNPVHELADVRSVDPALIRAVAFNVRDADDDGSG